MANYHVSKDKKLGYWRVKREFSNRISGHANTQHEAELLAKKFSVNSGGGEVRIHSLEGKIRDSDTVLPANDPFPPRDNKH